MSANLESYWNLSRPENEVAANWYIRAMSKAIQQMFDQISGRYDFLNRFLSLRRDVAWRKRACRMAGPGKQVLDLCGGTGDFWLTFRGLWGAEAQGVVGDFSAGMLKICQEKTPETDVVQLDALSLPFDTERFDTVLCGFGMRNLDHLERGISEISRVMVPGARFAVLEFFRPENWWTRFFYGILGAALIPLAGALLSGRREAYEYLVRSVQQFVTVGEFSQRAASQGLQTMAVIPLDGGIAHLVILHKEPRHGKESG